MALIGELPRFYGEYDDWLVFTEPLEQFFDINNVIEEKKKAILITSISDQIYKTLNDLWFPLLPKEKTFDELCELLNKQFVIKTSVIRERYAFYNTKQMGVESIANWFARIKKLSIDSKFGDRFDAILLDRFLSSLRPSPIIDPLCEEAEDKLTVQLPYEVAINKEISIKDNYVDVDKGEGDEVTAGNRRNCGGRNRRGNPMFTSEYLR